MKERPEGRMLREAIDRAWAGVKEIRFKSEFGIVSSTTINNLRDWPVGTTRKTNVLMRNKDPREGGREVWDTVMMARRGYIGTQNGGRGLPAEEGDATDRQIVNNQTEEGEVIDREADGAEQDQRARIREVVGELNQGVGNRGRNAGGGNRRRGQGNPSGQATPEGPSCR